MLTSYFAKNPQSVLLFRGVILFLVGAILLFLELMKTKKSWLMFISVSFMLIAVVLGMIDVGFLPLGVRNLWPIFVIIFGFTLILFSFYKFKQMKAVYLVPALVIIFFGIFFMLFSMGIIKVSFVSVASKLWPLLLVLCGGILITIFFCQQYNLVKSINETSSKEDDE
ncbi:MAG: hypothetical protein II232_07585 [Spirochaetaceae bacterium]|nr:hypothetical protein [Spirochaetaceae bacterium]